jgi:hypothetical protein
MLALPVCSLGHSQYMNFIPNGQRVPGVDGGPSHGAWHAVGHGAPDPKHDVNYLLAGFTRISDSSSPWGGGTVTRSMRRVANAMLCTCARPYV